MIEINDGMPDFETVWKNSFGQTQESLTENFRVYKTAENGDDESLENSLTREKRETPTHIEFKQLIVIATVLILYFYFINYLKKKRLNADRRRVEERRPVRSTRRSIAHVHGRPSNMFVIIHSSVPRPTHETVVIDLPTPSITVPSNLPNQLVMSSLDPSDLPPAYEACPTYDESIKNMKQQMTVQL